MFSYQNWFYSHFYYQNQDEETRSLCFHKVKFHILKNCLNKSVLITFYLIRDRNRRRTALRALFDLKLKINRLPGLAKNKVRNQNLWCINLDQGSQHFWPPCDCCLPAYRFAICHLPMYFSPLSCYRFKV